MPLPRDVVASVRTFARRHDLLRPGPLVVAVSGGADSTALVLILAELAPELGLVLHVAHFDHRTRATGANDAKFVADLAAGVGAPIRVGRAERATKSEDEARRARYAFLRRVASSIKATAIATGHTRDDQAETVLLHAARGSGLAGLAAMRPSRDGIVRPLLGISRDDTRAVCATMKIRPRADPSNRSLRFARNRVRLRVLPELAKLNPRATEALARLADAAADAQASQTTRVDALLAAATAGARDNAVATAGAGDDTGAIAGETIDLARLGGDAALREEALATAWRRATGRTLTSRGRAALAGLAARTSGTASLDLPGGRAERRYGTLRLAGALSGAKAPRPKAERPRRGPNEEMRALKEGTETEWQGWRVLLTRDGARADWPLAAGVPTELAEGLIVRARAPGDRLAGETRRKLQDVLTDAKVPAADRDRQPIIVTRTGEVWWVPGLTARPLDVGVTVLARRPRDEVDSPEPRRRTSRQVASTRTAARTRASGRKGT